MLEGYLVCQTGTVEPRKTAVRDRVILGRGQGCAMVIHDPAASRNHLEVRREGDRFYWRDLGSTNGTLLNGVKMLEGPLAVDDVIEVGQTRIGFEVEGTADDPLEEDDPLADQTKPSNREPPLLASTVFDASRAARMDSGGRAQKMLEVIYRVMNDIAANYEPCHLLDRILETTIPAIDGQRGAIFFADEGPERLGACPVCQRIHRIRDGEIVHLEPGAIQVSRSVARRVLEAGESVLFEDTSDADGAEDMASASIVQLKLHSIMCVPLRGKNGILGCLYVDSDRGAHQYCEDDLLLATAVGNSAGLAIENASFHQELLDKQRMQQEIEHAWTIQEGFLVRNWPDDGGRFDVYGDMVPAKTVGGDFYDYVQTDSATVGILIGDVSGKGMPAALAMAQILAEFRLRVQNLESPATVLESLNRSFCERSRRGTFCTACYVLLDMDTGRATFTNLGHHGGLHLKSDGVSWFGRASGPPIGILPDVTCEEEILVLSPGDAIVLFTDGVLEARRSDDDAFEEYGEDSVVRFFEDNRGQKPRALVEGLREDLRRHTRGAPPHDDCTAIALRYIG